MVDINKTLNPVQTSVPSEVAPVVDRSAEFYAEGAKSALEGIQEVQETNVKKAFVADLTDITNKENEFFREQKKLEDELITSKDKKTINDLHAKLLRLERGEQTGTLNPVEAETRRRALLSQAVNLNPWLASDFKALAAGIKGSGAGSLGSKSFQTPEQIAMDKARERAINNGISLPRQREIDAEDFRIARQEAAVKQATANGTLTFPTARLGVANRARTVAQSIVAEAFSMLKTDPKAIDQVDWLARIENAKSQVRRVAQEMEVALGKQGTILSDSDRTRIENDIKDELAVAEQFVKSKDKLNFLKRTRETIENEGVLTMSAMNPYFGAMVANGAEEKAWDLAFKIWPEFLGHVQRSGHYDTVKLLAENLGDPDAIAFTQAVEFNKAMYAKGLYNKIRLGNQPSNDYEKILMNGMASSLIKLDNVQDDPELGPVSKRAHDILLSGDNPEGELDHYLEPRVFKNTIKDKEAVSKLTRAVKFREANAVISAPRSLHTITPAGAAVKTHDIIYDPASKSFKVLDRRDLILQKANPDHPIRLTVSSHTQSLNRLLKLRTMYDMFGGMRREDYIQEILHEVNKEVTDD